MRFKRDESRNATPVAASQVRYPAELEVTCQVVDLGRSSFKMEYEIRDRGTEERVADGTGVIVWVDYGTDRSTPLPASLRAAILRYEGMEAGGE